MASSAFLTMAACCAIFAAMTSTTTTTAAAHPNPVAPPASSPSPSKPPQSPSPPSTNRRAADRFHHHYHHLATHASQAGRNFTGPPVSSRHGGRSLLFHFRTSPMDSLLSSKHSSSGCSSGTSGSGSSGCGGCGGGDGGCSSSRGGRQRAVSELRCSSTAGVQEEGPFVLEQVKNIRDLGSVEGSGIVRGRVFRTGHLSDATKADATALRDVTGLRTLVDLRSATELERDELIHGDMYEGFVNVRDVDRGTGAWEGGCVWDEGAVEDGSSSGAVAAAAGAVEGGEGLRRRRYFVSLIDESVYKKGVFQRLRRRHKAAVLALAPAAMVSRRFTQKARDIFIREINAGGLVLLNE
ncbi:unnamed protein product, partial [Laminaria digitata]